MFYHILPGALQLELCVQAVLCCSLLVAATLAAPQRPVDPEEAIPKPYAYQYGVADEVSKANFQKSESQDAKVSNIPIMGNKTPTNQVPFITRSKAPEAF